MEKCFVMQPFDNDKFDARFVEIFKPAITKAGFEAYRIDEDAGTNILIEDIERGISESAFCLAEVTTDNPNVWYELGFAFACKKDVIMVCEEGRIGGYPFDIRHRHVLTYKTSSPSDFTLLGESITKKINAFQKKSKTVKRLINTPVIETEGLKGHEIALLILIMENQLSAEDCASIHELKHEMGKSGYNDIATSVGIRTLTNNGMLETFKNIDEYNGQEYFACRLTEHGENWILSNQEQLQFRKAENAEADDNELPF